MKKIILSLSLCLSMSLFFAVSIYAANPTAKPTAKVTPAPTSSVIEKQINSLTDKIASRVAQLKLVDRRGVIGQVTDASNTQITISDLSGNTLFIDVDEFTKFNSPASKASFGISDIKKGDKLGVLGLYNKDSRRLLARFVDELELPVVLYGGISQIDDEEFNITITTDTGKEYSIDIESSTKTLSYDQEEKALIKSGFSKLLAGQRIVVVGFTDLRNSKIFEASRIIILPNVPVNPKIKISAPDPSPTPKEKE
ncbi:MAG: hypothetical protein AAB675_00315, partial [Patescibacteria group bacterium]